MPLRNPEPIAGIVLMRVVNPRAPRAGDVGWIVGFPRETQEMTYIRLEFPDGEMHTYERIELEIVMP